MGNTDWLENIHEEYKMGFNESYPILDLNVMFYVDTRYFMDGIYSSVLMQAKFMIMVCH
jgi:hypothetical protein